jgi:hypothetical protein
MKTKIMARKLLLQGNLEWVVLSQQSNTGGGAVTNMCIINASRPIFNGFVTFHE